MARELADDLFAFAPSSRMMSSPIEVARHGEGMALNNSSLALQATADQWRAVALAEVLVARASADAGFREALAAWWAQASQVRVGGDVAKTVSGGTQHGPVLQGRSVKACRPVTVP